MTQYNWPTISVIAKSTDVGGLTVPTGLTTECLHGSQMFPLK